MSPIKPNLGELELERRRRLAEPSVSAHNRRDVAAGGASDPLASPETSEELSILDRAGDILLGVPRGLVGAAQDLYGLADIVALDVLPDWETKIFGESRTFLGGLVEGVTNFAVGFVPAVGALSKVGKLSKAAQLAAKTARGAKLIEAGRFATAGAVADFAVFDGHEARLSDLVEKFPVLQNPVTDFLASSDDDPQLLGRVKTALEGIGVGVFTDALLLSLRALKAGKAVREAGGTPSAVQSAMDTAVPPDDLNKALSRGAELPEPELGTPAATPGADVVQSSLARSEVEVVDVVVDPARNPTPLAPTPSAEESIDILRSMDVSEEQAREILYEARSREGAGLIEATGIERRDPKINPRKLSNKQLAAQNLQKTDLNLSRFVGPEGALQYMRAMESILAPLKSSGPAIGGVRSLEEQGRRGLQTLADLAGEKPETLLAMIQKDVKGQSAINDRFLAYETAILTYAADVARKAGPVNLPGASAADKLQFKEMQDTLAEMIFAMKGVTGERARGLGSGRVPIRVKDGLFRPEELTDMVERAGGDKYLEKLARRYVMAFAEGGAASGVKLAKGTVGERIWGLTQEYHINSLLSGPRTVVVATLSNALVSVYRPFELMLGGALTLRSDVIARAAEEAMRLIRNVPQAGRMAWAALRTGDNLLDPKYSSVQLPGPRAWSPEAMGLADDSLMSAPVRWLGTIINSPSRVLGTSDELFKQLNFRAYAEASLSRDALKSGKTPEEAAAFVAEEMDKLVYQGQALSTAQLYHRGVDEAIKRGLRSKAAVEDYAREFVKRPENQAMLDRLSSLADAALGRAREVTQTTPLRPGTVGADIQRFVMAHPFMRLFLPFVRTSVNVATFAAQRLDVVGAARSLGALHFPQYASALRDSQNRIVGDVLSNNAYRQADAIGRLAAGIGLATTFFSMAMARTEDGLPLITGKGPKDPDERKLLEGTGWQPYSIRVGDSYLSYLRLDPFATIVGTAVDVVDFVRYAPPEDQEAVATIGYGFAAALANNFTNKTYLQGVLHLVSAVSDPARNMPKLVRSTASSFLAPSAVKSLVFASGDENMRDVYSILDAVRSRWPGASDDLPPMRNLLGEPVRRATSIGSGTAPILDAFVPILYREVSSDIVNRELAHLGHGFSPPRRDYHGIDLVELRLGSGQTAYDRFGQLHGEVRVRGKNIRQALERLIRSDRYQRMPDVSTAAVESPRIGEIGRVLGSFRRAALQQLLRESPELSGLERQRVSERRAAVAGEGPRASALRLVR